MDEFHFGNVKAEKARAMRRYNLFTFIYKTLRIIELSLALILLSWTLTRLPFAITLSYHFLHKLSAFAATPLVVFAISNAIIAALLAQRFAAADDDDHHTNNCASDSASDTIYQDFLNNRAAPPSPVYEDKNVISETVRDSDGGLPEYRRSQSEKWKGEGGKTMRKLRRSETEKVGENRGIREEHELYPQDKLSSEEFKRTIEAFIAKQMRFLREESSAIVVQNQSIVDLETK